MVNISSLSWDQKLRIVLSAISENNGVAKMSEIYQAVEKHLAGSRLSKQDKDSLRNLVNRQAVRKGYIYQHDRQKPGWRRTPKGRQLLDSEAPSTAVMVPAAICLSGPPVHVETKDLADEEIDQAIKANRLRIGIVGTASESILARRRIGQQRLRELTLFNYSSTCALCDVNESSLLVASHIVGWAENPEARGILSNLICLCRFHDPLFELGYWSLTDDLSVLKKSCEKSRIIALLLDLSMQFRRPRDHPPDPSFLRPHRLRCGFDVSM